MITTILLVASLISIFGGYMVGYGKGKIDGINFMKKIYADEGKS